MRPPRVRPSSLAFSALLLGAVLILAGLAPLLAPIDPDEQIDPAAARLRPPGTHLWAVRLAGPRWLLADRLVWRGDALEVTRLERQESIPRARVLNPTPSGVADRRYYLLGTDQLGRDLWSRMLHGARISLAIALLAAVLALTLGLAVGATAALGGRLLDGVLMRGVDALLAFPPLVLVLSLAALFRPTLPVLVLFIGGTSWMALSRIVRGELLSLREQGYALAARALGLSAPRLLLRHLLPNAMTPILVDTSLRVGNVILIEASLSFLGFGVQPPQASWGNLVAAGRDHLVNAWWLATLPGLAIALTVLACALLADGVRDRLDPRHRLGRRPPRSLLPAP